MNRSTLLPSHHKKKHSLIELFKGFTLIELLVVVAIIGILASLAITSFRFVLLKAQDTRNKSLAGTVGSAIAQYSVDHGSKHPVVTTDGGADLVTLENELSDYLKTNAAVTQQTGLAKYVSNFDGSSYAAAWELKYPNDPIVATGNGVYQTDGTGTISVPGTFGSSVKFSGPVALPLRYGIIPHHNVYNFSGDFSVSFWAKWGGYVGPFFNYILVQKANSTGPQPFSIKLGFEPGVKPTFVLERSNSSTTKTLYGAPDLVEKKWYHISVIKENANIFFLVNNIDYYATPQLDITGTTNNSANISLGSLWGGVFYYADASIDDLQIFNRALTRGSNSEVSSIYNNGLGKYDNPQNPNLVGRWRMNEGSGSSITDYSTTANHGTLYQVVSGVAVPGGVRDTGIVPLGFNNFSAISKIFVIYGPQ